MSRLTCKKTKSIWRGSAVETQPPCVHVIFRCATSDTSTDTTTRRHDDRTMGSTIFDDADPACAGFASSPDMTRARGNDGCAMASDRL